MKGARLIFWRLLVVIIILGTWQGLSGPVFSSFWVSRPSTIVIWLRNAILNGTLGSDLLITAKETVYGYLVGAAGGLMLAFVLAQSERAALVLRPFILAIYGIPRIALAPLFVLWFGIALTSKVMMAALVTLLLVFFNTYEGIRSANPELRNVALVMDANRWQLFWNVTLPDASPWILAGLRISIPQALVGAVVAEFIASTGGVGYLIMDTTSTLDSAGTMAGIIILMLVVLLLGTILDRIEGRLLRWRPQQNGTRKR
ncbi:MAG TPA: ABC transporter permease [Pseudolabrys sp.]|uniref:ABC transporter permease n=1 Tax=Pseudolabrys sp. TaxID=1960880 RepID=UPI002DDD3122|nr:ABC transporter permease [Pseudolabrys sp.]HEV2627668.1 ABC transporter permease [Pseudolabrys sp.]